MRLEFKLPFTDPVLVFSVVLLIILVSPILFSRVKIPGIVGLILSGVILGPHGVHVLERDSSIILFGTVGLLYIMFMAGLEMDMNDFKGNKNRSLVFGILTFVFPFILGFVAAHYVLQYQPMASVLLASMFSTHTLIAYPIVGRLGITQTRTMAVIIGGTIITDAAVLLILAVITNLKENEISAIFFAKLFSLIGLIVFLILWGVPKIGRWFFRNLESEGHSQYLFVLAIMFLSSLLAHLIGIEPIIGAFLAGLALNQLIPNTSTLMNRIEFVGNALFIPFFLISVGMLVDFRVLLKGSEALSVALLIILISFAGKWMAAFVTQKLFKFSRTERNLIWGMSSAHAAATIAVVIIGYNLKLLDENVLNGTILLILVSCLGSSLITEKAGRKIALQEENLSVKDNETDERILVPVANLNNVDRLVDFAIMIKAPKSREPIFPLYVLQNRRVAEDQIVKYQIKMHHALRDSGIEISKEPVFRLDINVANGILRAITELRITQVVIGWNGRLTFNKNFGPILDRIIEKADTQILICKLLQPLNTIKRIIVVIPRYAERESGFPTWIETTLKFSRTAGAGLVYYAPVTVSKQLKEVISPEVSQNIKFESFENWKHILALQKQMVPHDLLLVVQARKHTISYHDLMGKVPELLSRYFQPNNLVVLYPTQALEINRF